MNNSPLKDLDDFEDKLKYYQAEENASSSSSDEEGPPAQYPEFTNENVKMQSYANSLSHQVHKKAQEIETVEQSIRTAQGAVPAHGGLTKQIIHLAKSNRALQVSHESEKSKLTKINEDIEALRKRINRPKTSSSNPLANEEYKQKYIQYEDLHNEMKAEYFSIKTEISKAKEIVRREVGGLGKIDVLLNTEQWRERTQQLVKLKASVNDLKRQLTVKTPTAPTFNKKAKEIQKLNEELQCLEEEVEQWKRKAKGAGSRKAVLEREITSFKEQNSAHIKSVLALSDNNDKTIAELKEDIERIRNLTEIEKYDPTAAQNEIHSLKYSVSNFHSSINQLQNELYEKENIIKMFEVRENEDILQNEDDYRGKILALEEELSKIKATRISRADEKMIKDVSRQNERFRAKIESLTRELSNKRTAQ